jgi:integrase
MSPDTAVRPVAAPQARPSRPLTAAEFHQLAAVPPEAEWFANLDNPRTRRAYRTDLRDFMDFAGIRQPDEFRLVTRAHVLAWRTVLEYRALSGATIRRKLAALSSLFGYLCDRNAVDFNPVKGAKRPKVDSYEGKTPALGDHQARALLDAPDPATLKGKRDRALLSVLLYHGLRREELCRLTVRDIHARRGVPHLRIHGKGGKTRYLPLHPGSAERIHAYLDAAGHGGEPVAPLFQPVNAGRAQLRARRSRPMASINACSPTRRRQRSRSTASACTACARPPRPMRSSTRPTSRRCRNGSATRTSRPRGSTTGAGAVRRIRQPSRFHTKET